MSKVMATSLELAITAIRSGRKEEGRQLLNLLIQQNPNNEMAWLWMSSVVNNDEQRARCLYHVLAINPDNTIARRGLHVLGITVSDSRPVKVPRDSQPIHIPHPSPPPPTGPLKALPDPDDLERHSTRLDPQSLVEELPFTPVKPPFSKPLQPVAEATQVAVSSALPPAVNPEQPAPDQAGQLAETSRLPEGTPAGSIASNPSAAGPALHSAQAQPPAAIPPTPAQSPALGETQPLEETQAQVPPPPPQPAGAVPAGASQAIPTPAPGSGAVPAAPQPASLPAPTDQGALGNSPDPAFYPTNPGLPTPNETRPTQPYAGPSNPNPANVPYPPANPPYMQQPLLPGYPTNPTMNMPLPQPVPPHYSHSMAALHSQATMGMITPMYPGSYGQPGYVAHPSEPVPVIHSNTTMGMPMPGYLPNPVMSTNPTMGMATGQPHLVNQGMMRGPGPGAGPNGTKSKKQQPNQEEDEEEGVNVLAVIIFGSLSVTALGGLGMLILLMFTTG